MKYNQHSPTFDVIVQKKTSKQDLSLLQDKIDKFVASLPANYQDAWSELILRRRKEIGETEISWFLLLSAFNKRFQEEYWKHKNFTTPSPNQKVVERLETNAENIFITICDLAASGTDVYANKEAIQKAVQTLTEDLKEQVWNLIVEEVVPEIGEDSWTQNDLYELANLFGKKIKLNISIGEDK